MLTIDRKTGKYFYAIPDCHNKLNECMPFTSQMEDSHYSRKKNHIANSTTVMLAKTNKTVLKSLINNKKTPSLGY